jgi:small subunit ribosomal protein S6
MVNHYETVFVLTPVLSEPQMKEAVDKFENLLTQNGGTILNREEWGLRNLRTLSKQRRPDSTAFCSLM